PRITIAAILLLAAGAALAEAPGPPPDGAARLDRLAVLLDLDEGQKVAVKQVFEEQASERKALWDKTNESQTRPSREEMHAQHEKMRNETIDKLRPILSDQQMTKFQALTEGPPGGGHGPGRQHPDKTQ
ncbi:MAG TPA: hypothetical protein VIT67_17900, partial [Povalibacter sp.]